MATTNTGAWSESPLGRLWAVEDRPG